MSLFSYQKINAQLREARQLRVARGSTLSKRTFTLDNYSAVIQESPELNQRSSVRDIDYRLALFMVRKLQTKLKGKNVLVLACGVGLLGVTAHFLGAVVTLTESKELFPLIRKNLDLNNINDRITIEEFLWGELHQSSLTMQFFHYILLAVDINHSDEYLQNLIQGLISVAGNGTNLIVGYKKTIANEENILEFRLLLGQYFDFPSSRSVIYQCDSGEIIILQMKRKPFSNFLEKNL
jgi:hypothetical protein